MNILNFKKLSSTNDYIKQNISLYDENIAVFAETQIGGRGRRGKLWTSPESVLAMSFLIKNLNYELVSITAAVLTAFVIEKFGVSVEIKWPNDIVFYANGTYRKVCGILCEKVGDDIIIGVGVNIDTPYDFFVQNNLIHATALSTSINFTGNKNLLKNELLKAFSEHYDQPKNQISLLSEYKKRLVNINKYVKIIKSNSEEIVKAVDISETGELICEGADGNIFMVNSGEVSVRGVYGYA